MRADKCLVCNKGVRKAGDFSGAYHLVDRSDRKDREPEVTGGKGKTVEASQAGKETRQAKVHMECFEAYQAKLATEREESA